MVVILVLLAGKVFGGLTVYALFFSLSLLFTFFSVAFS